MKKNIKFLKIISGFDKFGDAYLEVVLDYRVSKYFSDKQVDDAIEYATIMAKAGHEIHFGPAVRRENLGSKRSDRTNVLWTKCLWVEIDSPDKTISSEEKLKAAELLKNNFMSALYPYGIEPSYIVCSGHGFHSYFILKEVHHDTFLWSPIKEALITLAKGDHQAKDMTRLLRVPGTLNWKDKDNPIPVELVFESDRIYDEDDFKQLVKDHIPKQILNITPNETS